MIQFHLEYTNNMHVVLFSNSHAFLVCCEKDFATLWLRKNNENM